MALNAKESALLDALEEAAAHVADMIDSVNEWESAENADKAELIVDFGQLATDGVAALDEAKRLLKGYTK
jgi:hypothetical protein